jgi:geranylgeranyl diphosphate synthase type II
VDKPDKEKLLKWLECEDKPQEKIVAVRDLYDKLDVPREAEAAIRFFYEKALTAFQAVSVNANKKEILKDIAKDLMEREF